MGKLNQDLQPTVPILAIQDLQSSNTKIQIYLIFLDEHHSVPSPDPIFFTLIIWGCYNRVKFEFFNWHFHAPSHTIGEPQELLKIIFWSKKPPPTWKKLNWLILPYVAIFSYFGNAFVYIQQMYDGSPSSKTTSICLDLQCVSLLECMNTQK